MMQDILQQIEEQIREHRVLLYIKGTPSMPRCGFSARVVESLMECAVPFSYVDILQHPEIRSTLPEYADWPTFPQLWINGELIGGCDIVSGLHARGELRPLLESAAPTEKTQTAG